MTGVPSPPAQTALQRRLVPVAGLNARAFRNRHLHIPPELGGGRGFSRPLADAPAVAAAAAAAASQGGSGQPGGGGTAAGTGGGPHQAPAANLTLDGDLLWRFAALPRPVQREVAEAAGLGVGSVDRLLADMATIDAGVAL